MIWKPHTTVAAIIERDKKFLMVEENIEGTVVINQPAGHLEPDENMIDAAIRETREETAWRFLPEALVGVYLWKQPNTTRTFLRFAFCGSCADFDNSLQLDDGIIKTVWLSSAELQSTNTRLRSPLVLKCIADYTAGKRYPLDTVVSVADTL